MQVVGVLSSRRWLLFAGPVTTLVAIGGLWYSSCRAERGELDRANAALAQSAAAYLSVVIPPGVANGYDPARLLSGANTLARASFWPGGLQLALGAVPLLPDTIGLAPVPDSLLRLLEQGRGAVIARHARMRAALVPFLDRDRWGMLGWVAVWNAVRPQLPSLGAGFFTVLAGLWVPVAALVFLRELDSRWRMVAIVTGLGLLLLLALDLGWSIRQASRAAAETRLLALKRLVEVAATAPGVRQAMLPELAVGVQVRPLGRPVTAAADVGWGSDEAGPALTVVAATPRSQGGLELTLHPDTRGLARLRLVLAGLVALGAAGLGLTAVGARAWGRGRHEAAPGAAASLPIAPP
jgi:hypothetical protein